MKGLYQRFFYVLLFLLVIYLKGFAFIEISAVN